MTVPEYLFDPTDPINQGHSAPFNTECGVEADVAVDDGISGSLGNNWWNDLSSSSELAIDTTTTMTTSKKKYDGPCMDITIGVGSNAIDFESDPSNPIFHRMVLKGGRGWSILNFLTIQMIYSS